MFTRIRKFSRFVKRLIRWVPILWDQEEWDFAYFYPLLKAKMEDIRANIEEDYWHDPKGIKRNLKEIDVCLARMDRYLNWTDYYDYPMEDIYMVPINGGYQMKYYSEENEKQRLGALPFEEKNYKKFWEDFVKWHRGWWT
jgi:hypothetical protein